MLAQRVEASARRVGRLGRAQAAVGRARRLRDSKKLNGIAVHVLLDCESDI